MQQCNSTLYKNTRIQEPTNPPLAFLLSPLSFSCQIPFPSLELLITIYSCRCLRRHPHVTPFSHAVSIHFHSGQDAPRIWYLASSRIDYHTWFPLTLPDVCTVPHSLYWRYWLYWLYCQHTMHPLLFLCQQQEEDKKKKESRVVGTFITHLIAESTEQSELSSYDTYSLNSESMSKGDAAASILQQRNPYRSRLRPPHGRAHGVAVVHPAHALEPLI